MNKSVKELHPRFFEKVVVLLIYGGFKSYILSIVNRSWIVGM